MSIPLRAAITSPTLERGDRHLRYAEEHFHRTRHRFRRCQDGCERPACGQYERAQRLAFDAEKHQLWVGDGDSTVKVIDVAANPAKIIATSTRVARARR